MAGRSGGLAAFAQTFGHPELFGELLDGLGEAVYIVDRQRTIRFWNRACEEISGYRAEDVVGHRCFENILRHIDDQGQQLCFGLCPLAHTMKDGQPRRCRVWLHHRNGHRLPVRVIAQPLRDLDGGIIGAIEAFSDDSSLAATRARLVEMERLAMVDPLTEIPNRRYLQMTLSSRLGEVRRHSLPLSVAIVDIDDFKNVNDRFGHQAGDKALKMVATVLAANERVEDIVARLGGDEFVLVLNHADLETATQACERLRMLIAHSTLELHDAHVQLTTSIGVTTATPRDDPDSVLARADELLYQAKAERNRVVSAASR